MKKWRYIIVACCLFFSASLFAQQPTPLPVDQAFHLSVKDVQENAVQLHWDIAPGYHLYRDRFKFMWAMPKESTAAQVVLPAGIPTHDDILGNYQIYVHHVDISVPLIKNKADENKLALLVTYQGCSDSNFCYPPVTKQITLHLQDLTHRIETHHPVGASPLTLQDKVSHLLQEKNYPWIFLVFIGLGLLLSFTPCVLPMIPILSGIIVGQDRQNLTTRRAFFLSLSYVIGMSLMYAIAGVLVALLGNHLSETFQAPWVIILFSLLFVLLALSLFGFYELKLPDFLHHRILHLSNKQKSGSYVGAFIMGALSVLIVSPCVTAPLVGVLTFIAQSGNVVLGSAALFSLGIGMGLPLLIIGTTEGRLLPKSGYWMQVVKSTFGVLMLAVALYLLQRLLPGAISLMLWAAFLIILAAYLGVGTHYRRFTSGWIAFSKGIGLLFFCYGVILLVGGALGNTAFFHPLRFQHQEHYAADYKLQFKPTNTLTAVQTALQLARQQHKVVMLDFYADWCVACHEMDENTFSDPAVKTALKGVVLLRADVTANDASARALENYFKVIAPPTMLFFGPDGKEYSQFRLVGGMSPQGFLQHIHTLSSLTGVVA